MPLPPADANVELGTAADRLLLEAADNININNLPCCPILVLGATEGEFQGLSQKIHESTQIHAGATTDQSLRSAPAGGSSSSTCPAPFPAQQDGTRSRQTVLKVLAPTYRLQLHFYFEPEHKKRCYVLVSAAECAPMLLAPLIGAGLFPLILVLGNASSSVLRQTLTFGRQGIRGRVVLDEHLAAMTRSKIASCELLQEEMPLAATLEQRARCLRFRSEDNRYSGFYLSVRQWESLLWLYCSSAISFGGAGAVEAQQAPPPPAPGAGGGTTTATPIGAASSKPRLGRLSLDKAKFDSAYQKFLFDEVTSQIFPAMKQHWSRYEPFLFAIAKQHFMRKRRESSVLERLPTVYSEISMLSGHADHGNNSHSDLEQSYSKMTVMDDVFSAGSQSHYSNANFSPRMQRKFVQQLQTQTQSQTQSVGTTPSAGQNSLTIPYPGANGSTSPTPAQGQPGPNASLVFTTTSTPNNYDEFLARQQQPSTSALQEGQPVYVVQNSYAAEVGSFARLPSPEPLPRNTSNTSGEPAGNPEDFLRDSLRDLDAYAGGSFIERTANKGVLPTMSLEQICMEIPREQSIGLDSNAGLSSADMMDEADADQDAGANVDDVQLVVNTDDGISISAQKVLVAGGKSSSTSSSDRDDTTVVRAAIGLAQNAATATHRTGAATGSSGSGTTTAAGSRKRKRKPDPEPPTALEILEQERKRRERYLLFHIVLARLRGTVKNEYRRLTHGLLNASAQTDESAAQIVKQKNVFLSTQVPAELVAFFDQRGLVLRVEFLEWVQELACEECRAVLPTMQRMKRRIQQQYKLSSHLHHPGMRGRKINSDTTTMGATVNGKTLTITRPASLSMRASSSLGRASAGGDSGGSEQDAAMQKMVNDVWLKLLENFRTVVNPMAANIGLLGCDEVDAGASKEKSRSDSSSLVAAGNYSGAGRGSGEVDNAAVVAGAEMEKNNTDKPTEYRKHHKTSRSRDIEEEKIIVNAWRDIVTPNLPKGVRGGGGGASSASSVKSSGKLKDEDGKDKSLVAEKMQRYKVSKMLGDGTFGCVMRARNKQTSEPVAIKKMKKKFYSWDD
eukprot:g14860.t1